MDTLASEGGTLRSCEDLLTLSPCYQKAITYMAGCKLPKAPALGNKNSLERCFSFAQISHTVSVRCTPQSYVPRKQPAALLGTQGQDELSPKAYRGAVC